MNKQKFDVNNLRVASPCSVGWETMSGDERIRRCHSCKLDIYNISEMTKSEVENLIIKREERICIRLYRRIDGTVLTKDCPVGFRAYQKRVARFAGAVLATVFGLFSASFGQKEDKKVVDASKVKIIRTVNQNQESILSGVIYDPSGALIPSVEINLYKKGRKKPLKINSDAEGNYNFKPLSSGIYAVEVKLQGFKKYKVVNLEIKDNEKSQFDIILEPSGESIIVGIYAEEPLIDTTSSSITTKITRKQINSLPY